MIPASDLWMLGLRPGCNDERGAPAPPGGAAPAVRSSKYVVVERLGRWRVQRDDEDASAFASLDDAVSIACAQASEQAKTGVLGVVVVQSEVQEMRCFTPPAGVLDAAPASKLRLVGGAGR